MSKCILLVFLQITGLQAKQSTLTIEKIFYNNHQLDRDSINQLLRNPQGIELPNRIRNLEIELTASNPKLMDYRYQLIGLDEKIYRSSCPCLRYTNIRGGRYILKIGAYHEQKQVGFLKVPIQVALSPEEHWWFWPLLSFCVIMIPVVIVYFFLYDKSKQRIGVETVRNQIASDLHDYVTTHIAAISGITDGVHKHRFVVPPEVIEALSKIKNYSREAIELLEATVWAINPANESIEELIRRMEDYAANALCTGPVDLHFENHYQPKSGVVLDMQQRFSLDGMFKEAIRNIVKHAEATRVDITIHNERNSLEINIQDNGKGFDEAQEYQGQGLKNFRRRAKENYFDLKLDSELGKGTRIQITAHGM